MGRELDVKVAKALGWEWDDYSLTYEPPPGQTRKLWSTDIAAAWELVEMAPQVFYLDLHTGQWWAMYGDDLDGGCFGTTAPEAICKAFLAWKEADDGPS